MSYTDEAAFLDDFHQAQNLALQQYGPMGGDQGIVSDEVAWATYVNASQPASEDKGILGLMVFGRHERAMRKLIKKRAQHRFEARQELIDLQRQKDRESWFISRSTREQNHKRLTNKNFARKQREDSLPPPASVDTDPEGAMVKNFGLINNEQSGSILLMDSDCWSFTINDTWLVSAVHQYLPFYPASAVAETHIFSDKRVLTITGRELFGLALFGYRQIECHPDLGCAFQCVDTDKADQATLVALQQALSGLTCIDDARQVFAQAGFQINQVGFMSQRRV